MAMATESASGINSNSSSNSSSSSSSTEDFEFNTCGGAGVDVKGADDLFFKGQLLPLALPPRLHMVHSLSARKGECEEAAAAAATAAAATAAAAPWLFYMAVPPTAAAAAAAAAFTGQGEATAMSAHAQQQQQVQLQRGPHVKSPDTACAGVGSRNYWGDSSSAQPSSDSSSADSSSDARDSSGSSKDSVDLSAPSDTNSASAGAGGGGGGGGGGGYSSTSPGGHRARHDKFFHALSAFGGKANGARLQQQQQQELQQQGDGGRHARIFSWLKPSSARWNGIFGGGGSSSSSKKKNVGTSTTSTSAAGAGGRRRRHGAPADASVVGDAGPGREPPRDWSSSDELASSAPGAAGARQLRMLRHSGPLTSSCADDDLVLVSCRERLSGPLVYRAGAGAGAGGAGGTTTAVVPDQPPPLPRELAEEKREWQSAHSSLRESGTWEAFAGASECISSGADDGMNRSGRDHWRMNPSFNYDRDDAGTSYSASGPGDDRQQPQLVVAAAAELQTDDGAAAAIATGAAGRGSVKAAPPPPPPHSKRRDWGTTTSVSMDTSGRHRYLDKLFRSLHVRVPIKSSCDHPAPVVKMGKSSRRTQTSANVPMTLNPICSTSTELHSSIQGAIAYCKRTHGSCKAKGGPGGLNCKGVAPVSGGGSSKVL